MKRESIYTVVFKTWIKPYRIDVPVKAYDEDHAMRIARRICKFGMVDQVLELDTTEAGFVLGTSYPVTEKNTSHLVDVDRDID
jgi:hypothetical protein